MMCLDLKPICATINRAVWKARRVVQAFLYLCASAVRKLRLQNRVTIR